MIASLEGHLAPVLDSLTFPANRWEIVMTAESYGADLRTRAALRGLTRKVYFSREMLLREIAAHGGTSECPVEATARPPRVPPRARRPRGHALVPPSPHRSDRT